MFSPMTTRSRNRHYADGVSEVAHGTLSARSDTAQGFVRSNPLEAAQYDASSYRRRAFLPLFDPGHVQILQIDEALRGRERLLERSRLAHQGDRLSQSLELDFSLFRQNLSLGFEK